ncbi:MAG: D-alanyl-D-alanine carboxypeptidase family protein [Patescibacteria group bacterium]|nr:D-alanyl-D-alanine carboxypeptidase family protein [Patescibacteria group bacterium]
MAGRGVRVGDIIFRVRHRDIRSLLPGIAPAGVVLLVLGGFLGYQFVQISALTKNVDSISAELASTTAALSENTRELSLNITDVRAQTVGLSDTLSSTRQHIDAVSSKVGGVEQTVGTISGAVGTLEKLAQTDPELLKKYSKVYFMNENYTPAHLADIPAGYLYSETKPERFLTEAQLFLKSLLDAAKAGGVTLYVKSAFRSFGEQESLKSAYTVVYGAGTANSFSADQGYSEHQLGTTVDLITTGLGGQLDGFGDTAAYQWLLGSAYRYGFVLSYPKDNGFYIYEPWHWRFVGVKLATYLHDNNMNFYDMDQRDIDAYLANIFD